MARPEETGFLFIPLDVDVHTDPKIRRLIRRCGGGATDVYIALLCLIFREGYYIRNEEDLAFILSERTGFEEDQVVKVLHGLLDVGLLDKGLYSSAGILTSAGIQKRWQYTIAQLKRTARINEFALVLNDMPIIKNSSKVSSEETMVNSEETGLPSEEKAVSSESNGVSSFLGKPYKGRGKKEIEERNKISSSCSSSSFTLSAEAKSAGGEKEKEEIIYYFTFYKNFMRPADEYNKLVQFNAGSCPWAEIAPDTKEEIVARWRQIPERKPRFTKSVLRKWQAVVDVIIGLNPADDILLCALSDKLAFTTTEDGLVIYCQPSLRDFIEDNIPALKPSVKDLARQFGKENVLYKNI